MGNIRIIPRLDIKGPNLVKGIHLEGLRVLGKPADFARHYYENGADELIFQDVVASLYERNSLHDIISQTAQQIFIPITVGGGLRSLDDIREVLRAGADPRRAGGKPLGGMFDFYQTQNEIELQDAIQAIVDDAQSCTVNLDPPPFFPDFVEVIMDGENVPMVMDCENEDGWVYTNPNGPYTSLELCGIYCENVPNVQEFVAEYYCNAG